jgi:membrane protein required for colicin V production
MLGPITYLDAALLAVWFISGLLAMYRGFAREMLSIASWVVAGAAVAYFVLGYQSFAQDLASRLFTNVKVAQIAVGAVIFLIVLIVVHLITARISDAIQDSRVGMIDRVLGFAFGVLRGFIIIVVPFMFAEFFAPSGEREPATQQQQPTNPVREPGPWYTRLLGREFLLDDRSLFRPWIKGTGDALHSVLDAHLPSSLSAPPGEQPPQGPSQEEQQAP